jgi:hypothetical protein
MKSMDQQTLAHDGTVTGHPNGATDGHLNDASKHERFSDDFVWLCVYDSSENHVCATPRTACETVHT